MFFVCTICSNKSSFGAYLCKTCQDKISCLNNHAWQSNLELNLTPLRRLDVCAYTRYEGIMRAVILVIKYSRNPQLSQSILNITKLSRTFFANSILCPVPLHPRRLLQRRFNQATEIARAICTQVPTCRVAHLLKRQRHTKPQRNLSTRKRMSNIKGSIKASSSLSLINPTQRIILIDDVCTTGATLVECAEVLYAQGVSSNVQAFVLALAAREKPFTD